MSSRENSNVRKFEQKKERFWRNWYNFSRNKVHVLGLVILTLIVLAAVLAPFITPYPEHAGRFTNFPEASKPPSLKHFFGTDNIGRDIFTRIIFGFRFSLQLAIIVVAIGVPPGVILGLLAGYYEGTLLDSIIMRLTDIFLSVPPLVLALAITSMLGASFINQMMALSIVWWPWYARLVYSTTRSLRSEAFVQEAKLTGASLPHILFKEILPNCLGSILTKVSLDMGFVIILGASLSFVGLGVQPPKPGLGTMVSNGTKRLPGEWWGAIFPALAIILVILSFNLIGDGLDSVFAEEGS